jgi:hypothetical protein
MTERRDGREGLQKKATFAWRDMDSGLRRDEEKKKRLK